MQISRVPSFLLLAAATVGCGSGFDQSESPVATSEAVTTDPISICNQDPRVNMNLVPLAVCAGARVFFDQTFNGNGRTCGTCHSPMNNFTIDPAFVASLPASDPLFVNENPAFNLAGLETPQLRANALVKENVDGFENNDFKFVIRSTPHVLSMATSIARDPADGTSAAFTQRTGWGGDGAPGDGSLRSFLDGAIKQHYTKDISRTPGTSFRFATEAEKDQVLAFQLALGRTADINLANVTMANPEAAAGQADFVNPLRGRCNQCHGNAGANFLTTGKNRNLNTGLINAPVSFVQQPDGSFIFDGGFGGQGLATPNLTTVTGKPDAFGDGTFSTPPLIEAADTGPFFHTGGFGNIESAISFYATNLFTQSKAATDLDAQFGAPIDIGGTAIQDIGSFLRVLNASFNLAEAAQRLDASRTLNIAFWAYRDDIQKGLIKLAAKEVSDALTDLAQADGAAPLHPAQQTQLQNVLTLLTQAGAASDPAVRRDKTIAALSSVQSAKAAFGTGMNFTLGTGDLMF